MDGKNKDTSSSYPHLNTEDTQYKNQEEFIEENLPSATKPQNEKASSPTQQEEQGSANEQTSQGRS